MEENYILHKNSIDSFLWIEKEIIVVFIHTKSCIENSVCKSHWTSIICYQLLVIAEINAWERYLCNCKQRHIWIWDSYLPQLSKNHYSFSSFLFFLQIFEFKPNRSTVLSHRKRQINSWSEQKKRIHYAAVSTLCTMFKVAFEELNVLKQSRIIQVFSDPQDAWVNRNTLDREVQCVSRLLTSSSPKEMV